MRDFGLARNVRYRLQASAVDNANDPGGTTVNGTQLNQQDCYGNVSEVWAAT